MGVVATLLGILRNGYNFLHIRQRLLIFASIPMCLGSANPLNVFLIPPNYYTTGKSNMAAVRSITLILFMVIVERGTVLLIMAFVRAERQRECLPDVWAVNQMMPYFYTAVR